MGGEHRMIIGGRYELVERVAEGGMAIVWKARISGAAGFCRTVAVKEIKIEYRNVRHYIEMFIEEARIGTELAHPNIVQVLDFVVQNNTHYLVLEWVEGIDLRDFAKAFALLAQPIPWPLAVAAAVGALQGLGAAHERIDASGKLSSVVHRDVSPHNILINCNGTVKLSDFGLARARDRAFSLTAPGTLKGKTSYFSPEIAEGKDATVLSDQFSMGCALWETLAAERLFDGRSDVEVLLAVQKGRSKDLSNLRSDVPVRVVRAVHRSLAQQPEERFPSARAFAAELSDCLRELGGGLYDASERLAAAVSVARQTLRAHEVNPTLSATQMNSVTMSFEVTPEAKHFSGATEPMDAQEDID